ncbi:hypothetical protein K1719_038105 [Acacia pycnantha]|nr:hypothetical protein K1719_038105 [Acacia pycnantha]
MEAIMKQIKHQLFQKQEQIRAIQQNLMTARCEEADRIRSMQLLAGAASLNIEDVQAVPVLAVEQKKEVELPTAKIQKGAETSKSPPPTENQKKTWADITEE